MNQKNNQIIQFQRELSLSSSAKKHLQERNFSIETIEEFCVGFCPSCSSYSFDLLNGRVIVPIFDVYGDFIAYSGRKIQEYSTEVKEFYQSKTNNFQGLDRFLKWKTSKWINTPYLKSNHLFNLNNAKKFAVEKNYCFIVEGYYDVMRLWELGFKNVIGLCGTTLTNTQCDLLYRYCDHLIIMLDGDDAGKTATNRVVNKARSKRLYCSIVDIPSNLDPDDLTKETLEFISKEIENSDEELYIKL